MSSTKTARRGRQPLPKWIVVGALMPLCIGCPDDLGPFVARDWGLVTIDHQTVGGSDYTRPQALFYSSPSSPTLSGRGAADVCGRFPYPSPSDSDVDEISAGPSVTLTMQGTAHSLVPTPIGNVRPYSLPEPGIPYRPGDSVVVEIPGAADGFPQMSIRGRTAEPFALGPIDPSLASSGEVTWTPAGDDSSRMVLSMQYHDDARPGGVNSHVFCTFRDDGVHTVPDLMWRAWVTSTGGRRVQAVRWRSSAQMEADAVLYLVSTYTVTKTSFP